MVWACIFWGEEIMSKVTLRCAIYTRKSSEEGLEQGFNSLDAQREACEAFILSQQHEGWKLVPTFYDDGGYSGGNIERPALKQLLADIDQKKVNVVVVYKVDRLTRSLADFAKIVELFDAKGISFVSVTQQFNTTSSMGRLTLNVLLSFAQFEREVTGERIRDKIAASKQKGMWMGGTPPVGYRGKERTLEIDASAAPLVKVLYERYLIAGSVGQLKAELDQEGIVSPIRLSNAKKAYGGRPFSRGQLYRILSDPSYLGKIRHKELVYPGQHPAIIDQSLWDAAQLQTLNNKQGTRKRRTQASMSLLVGRLFDEHGSRLVPSHSQKQSKRYRYYLSESLTNSGRKLSPNGIRVPAQELEMVIINYLCDWLKDHQQLIEVLRPEPEELQRLILRANALAAELRRGVNHQFPLMQSLIARATLGVNEIKLKINAEVLSHHEGGDETYSVKEAGSTNITSLPFVYLTIPAQLKRCGHSMRLLVSGQQPRHHQPLDIKMVNGLVKAHDWLNQLTSGKVCSVGEIAKNEGVVNSHITRTIYRAFLAPDIVQAILNGSQPIHLTSDFIKRHSPLPIDWDEQRKLLRFTPTTY